jgi:hypothetical protein
MAPLVKNVTDDPLELPSLGIPSTPPGTVIEVDDTVAAALDGHPCWQPATMPEQTPAVAAAPAAADPGPPPAATAPAAPIAKEA